MRCLVPAVLLALASCASGPDPEKPRVPNRIEPDPIGMNLAGDDVIVAYINKKPVTAREVADRAMAVEPKRLIDTYIRWRIRDNRLRELGIVVTPGDAVARARAHPVNSRRDGNEESVKQELAKLGKTEEEYVQWLAAQPLFVERVAAERAIVYDMILEGAVEFDAVAFTDEKEAIAFQSKLRNGADLNVLVKDLRAAKVQVGRWPRMCVSRSLALPVLVTDEWLLKHLFELKDGGISGIEHTSSGYYLVFRCIQVHPKTKGAYAERREDVNALLARVRIDDSQLEAWHATLAKNVTVVIEKKYQPEK